MEITKKIQNFRSISISPLQVFLQVQQHYCRMKFSQTLEAVANLEQTDINSPVKCFGDTGRASHCNISGHFMFM